MSGLPPEAVTMLRADVDTAELELLGPKATATAGEPVESCLVLYERDGTEAGVWECTPGSFASRWEGIVEVFHITAGEGILTDGAGVEHALVPGAVVVIPPGSTGTWEIRETIRKSYVITAAGRGA